MRLHTCQTSHGKEHSQDLNSGVFASKPMIFLPHEGLKEFFLKTNFSFNLNVSDGHPLNQQGDYKRRKMLIHCFCLENY